MTQHIKNKMHIPLDTTTPSDSLLSSLRYHLARSRVLSMVRILRTAIHFGPWRIVPIFLIRHLRPVGRRGDGRREPLLDFPDAKTIAKDIQQNSVVVAGVLPTDFVNALRAITDRLPVNHYQLMHRINENVRRLSEDPAIQSVLRAYFGCEPTLLESTLMVTGSHQIQGCSEQNMFHFDYAGWESLNVFVYLNDVDMESSAHMVAKGSHRDIGLRDVIRGCITDEEALCRFGPAIEAITGPAGTVFFENTEAFHRRNPGGKRRVMLNLLYASHRGWLSHGRTSREHLKRRQRAYDLALSRTLP